MPVLVVNVDHVATVRQARLAAEPDPVTAALSAEMSGAAGIIVHLREDRRHIQDRDVEVLGRTLKTRLHLEMAATAEMQGIALATRPHMVCLVPEKRQELTTEGGLAVAGREAELREFLTPLRAAGSLASLFIDADPAQVEASKATGCEFVEIHTGHYADALNPAERRRELERILAAVRQARSLGMEVNLGHGLDYRNIMVFADVPGIAEFSIGHSIIARAVQVGIERAVADMAALIRGFVN